MAVVLVEVLQVGMPESPLCQQTLMMVMRVSCPQEVALAWMLLLRN